MTSIIGHQKILENLKKVATSNSSSHAYLFLGQKGLGKFTTGLYFSRILNCADACENCSNCRLFEKGSHPDLFVLEGEEKIKIEDARRVKEFIKLKPYQAEKKIVLIKDISRFTIEAANSLLKNIEEPDGRTVFILTAESHAQVLETIASRCQIIHFRQVLTKNIKDSLLAKTEEDRAEVVSRLSLGRPGVAHNLLEKNLEDKINLAEIISYKNYNERFEKVKNLIESETIRESIDDFALFLRDILLIKVGLDDRIVNLKELHILKSLSLKYSNKKIKQMLQLAKEIKEGVGQGINTKLQLEYLSLMI